MVAAGKRSRDNFREEQRDLMNRHKELFEVDQTQLQRVLDEVAPVLKAYTEEKKEKCPKLETQQAVKLREEFVCKLCKHVVDDPIECERTACFEIFC
jgi:hypothetical protein